MFIAPQHQKLSSTCRSESIARTLRIVAIALCGVALILTLMSRFGVESPEDYPIFWRLLSFNDSIAALAVFVSLLLSLSLPSLQQAIVLLAEIIGKHPIRVVLTAFAVLAICSRLVYLAHPLSMDEYAPLMQANAFAQGSLTAHYPPELLNAIVPQQFQGVFIGVDRATGEAISKYWPGLAVMMAPFAWLNIEWLLNPAFGALALAMVYRLVNDVSGNRTAAGWAMLAALASPQFTVNAISYYAMPGELALNLLFVWLVLNSGLRSAFAAGLVGSLSMVMHNPAPHVLIALPCLAWLACNRHRWPRLLVLTAGYIPFAVLLGLGWSVMMSTIDASGRAAPSPVYQSMLAGTASFIRSFLVLPDPYLLTVRWYATWKAWIWACPGLLLFLFVPRIRGTCERLLLAGLIITYLFYFFVRFDQGHGWGYRYIHGAWGALPIIAGLWLATATDAGRRFAGTMVAAGLLATPVFMWQTHATIREALSWRLNPTGPGDWVIFVSQETGRYRGDLIQNPPGQENLYLVSRGHAADRALVARLFPGAVEVEVNQRGSSWRLPQGHLAPLLRRGSPNP